MPGGEDDGGGMTVCSILANPDMPIVEIGPNFAGKVVGDISRREALQAFLTSATALTPLRERGLSQVYVEKNTFTELDTYFRDLDKEIGIGNIYDPALPEEAIRTIRNEHTDPQSAKRLRFIISDTVWQRIVSRGEVGTNDPLFWLSAHVALTNRLLEQARVNDEITLQPTIKANNRIAESWEVLPFRSEQDDPRLRGNWRNHALPGGVLAQHPNDDVLWVLADDYDFDKLSYMKWMENIPGYGRIKIDLGLIHELTHLSHDIFDYYYSSGFLNLGNTPTTTSCFPNDIMSQLNSPFFSPATAITMKMLQEKMPLWRSIQSDKFHMLTSPHTQHEIYFYYLFSKGFHLRFLLGSDDTSLDQDVTKAHLHPFLDPNTIPIQFNPNYSRPEDLPPDAFLLDASIQQGIPDWLDPAEYKIGVFGISYQVGNFNLPIPVFALNLASYLTVFENPDYKPNLDIRFRVDPRQLGAMDNCYVYATSGKPHRDLQGIIAECQLPGSDIFLCWSSLPLSTDLVPDVPTEFACPMPYPLPPSPPQPPPPYPNLTYLPVVGKNACTFEPLRSALSEVETGIVNTLNAFNLNKGQIYTFTRPDEKHILTLPSADPRGIVQ